ncbi:MAG: Gfo/Idh/MocA family oxidoreductase [Mariniblastus sp.]|nr:Gfo/Idh/MocA family oxidoreductase [Mariniblastus sp.]
MIKKITRREFVSTTAAVASMPCIVPASVLAGSGTVPPSDRIVMAAIGSGGKGQHNTNAFLSNKSVQFVAVCDVDQNHLKAGVAAVNKHYGNQDCAACTDLREIICRGDIDAVHVSTPDHWHAAASVRALGSGKDVYCEKPLANSFGESKAIREAVKRSGRVLQCGSHERSNNNCRFAAELVRNGRLGKIETVRINMPCEQQHHLQARGTKSRTVDEAIPDHLNWDMWLGPALPTTYWSGGSHFWWRFILNHGGGEMTDRGAHIIDIAQLALGMDNSGPVEFVARGIQQKGCPYDAFWDYEFTNTYANGVKLIGSTKGPRGLRFEGTDGWLFVAIHGGKMTASNPDLLPENVRRGQPIRVDQTIEEFETQLGRSPGHHRDFIDCVKSRKTPMATAEIGHRTATICHLNNIAMRVGRPVRWNPQTEVLINDAQAAEWLVPPMRSRWAV